MLLYIYADGNVKQVSENPTVVDLLAVSQGLLSIVKFDKKKGFIRLIKDEKKLVWIPVKDTKTVTIKDSRIHL